MRRFAAILFLLAAAGFARAADERKPNTLTPKEIADGWILLFDGVTTFGWDIQGESAVTDGWLVLGGKKTTTATPTTFFPAFEAVAEYQVSGVAANLHIDSGKADPGTSSSSIVGGAGSVLKVKAIVDPQARFSTEGKARMETGRPSTLEKTFKYRDLRPMVRFEAPAGTTLMLRSFKLRPLDAKPIFNGKDLTGWKKYTGDEKRAKTEFSVTKEGLLHLKNGPGDLQSEGQYDDFILQAECRTNGKNLNSGVFFRCIPGEYQNGYEAQIHNGFGETPKEYTVEEYDPKTHELKDKTKVKSAALDYGSGAIYRRVPARSPSAKDAEWFTMTVAAQGRHIATWVNGVQQVDWTDNRPLNDNPRNGCRLEKGPISLQGHDPTTDIDFRSIRVIGLPRIGRD
jgi:Domain of Unknown Function (DUF1080)